jgi:hypothetical protein
MAQALSPASGFDGVTTTGVLRDNGEELGTCLT